jgi:hypothetical protein
MTDTTNLVATLISQHRILQDNLGQVNIQLTQVSPSGGKIDEFLKIFASNLKGHLALENSVFYVELIKKMEDKGEDTTKTKEFIAEMDKIGEVVMAFLGKFHNSEIIEKQIDEFKESFTTTVETLNMRIETEESGVYLYWN